MEKFAVQPMHGNERIMSIDILRGLAIAGIFFANMPGFLFPVLYDDPFLYVKGSADAFIYKLIDILAQASFYPLFAFLFGYGLVIMKERIDARGQSFVKVALRRMGILLVFGVVHAFFIWSGDILIVYAVFGLLLIPVIQMKVSPKTLAIVALLMYTIPGIFLIFLYHFLYRSGLVTWADLFDPIRAGEVVSIYREGSFLEIISLRLSEWAYVNISGLVLIFLMVYPLLLLGVSCAKGGILLPGKKQRRFFRKILFVSFPAGFLAKLALYGNPDNFALELLQDWFGGPLLTAAYIAIVYLLVSKRRKFLTLFSYVGRLSLSNYIFQSLIFTLFVYSYGLGLYATLSYTIGAVLVLIILICQLLFSHLWLKYFRLGPLEWLWRWGTYGKKPQLKMNKESMEA